MIQGECLSFARGAAITIAAILIVLILIAGYLGFIPGLSDIMGSGPRDLGISYNEGDYLNSLAKVPGHSVSNAEHACFSCIYASSGGVAVDKVFTQEEITSQINKLNKLKGPMRDVQVLFNGDGTIEMSGRIYEGIFSAPFYVKARIAGVSQRKVMLDVEDSEASKFKIPRKDAQHALEHVMDDIFTKNPGLGVESIEVGSGTVHFKGTVPKQVNGDPGSSTDSFSWLKN